MLDFYFRLFVESKNSSNFLPCTQQLSIIKKTFFGFSPIKYHAHGLYK